MAILYTAVVIAGLTRNPITWREIAGQARNDDGSNDVQNINFFRRATITL